MRAGPQAETTDKHSILASSPPAHAQPCTSPTNQAHQPTGSNARRGVAPPTSLHSQDNSQHTWPPANLIWAMAQLRLSLPSVSYCVKLTIETLVDPKLLRKIYTDDQGLRAKH